ncbi:hypothetical protein LSH36_75g11008 [Paralvinella palmiformis]|uniref:Uncharacterized protein n=1 Tax=Paralvinella palmiformis TaxID=53620 RepID=A0AAD9K3I8_9ANNE|nr:hypothetical protein LSH36_75g11008 [Paralvinella palmiformis]
MQTFAVRNENASEPADTRNEQSYPLLKRSESSREKNKARDKNDNTNGSAEPQQDPEIQADPSESLLPKEKSASQDQVSADVTLDTYDLTKNPFFAKE